MATAPQTHEEAHGAHDELSHLRALWERHGRSVMLGAAVALVVAAGFTLHRRRSAAASATAAETLLAARTPGDLERLVREHRGSHVAPAALLRAAKLYFEAGDFDAASERYARFLEDYPDHLLAPVAVMGGIACEEARGRAEQALPRYAEFAAANPGSFLAPQAVLGQSRCLEQTGQPEAARQALLAFLDAHPESGWEPVLRGRIEELDRKIGQAGRETAAAQNEEPSDA